MLFELMEKRRRDRLTSGVWLRALEAGDKVAEGSDRPRGPGTRGRDRLGGDAPGRRGGRDRWRARRASRSEWLSRIEAAAGEHTFFQNRPEFRLAELGDLGGAIGATMLVE